MFPPHLALHFVFTGTLLLEAFILASACAPSFFSTRRNTRTGSPLVYKEYVPTTAEFSYAASGPPQGKITRHDPEFRDLIINYSKDIVFKDDEGDASDRVMSVRLKEVLDILSVMVINAFHGIKVRVVEAWEEGDLNYPMVSLHNEGRAVDITTSDRDQTKLGLLGRLAYEAGFDFVSYESRSYIHCSVKTKYPDYRRLGGCFSGNSMVYTPEGEKLMSKLHVGDKVLVVTPNGDLDFSEVILFLDRDSENSRWYRTIVTENNTQITVTSKHLIYTASEEKTSYNNSFVTYVKNIRIGNYIYVLKTARQNEISLERVVNITVSKEIGFFAPLTKQGTIVVNNVVASCYAVVSDHALAHFAFSPMRNFHNFKEALWHFFHSVNLKIPPARHQQRDGIHWYAKFLYKITEFLYKVNEYFSY